MDYLQGLAEKEADNIGGENVFIGGHSQGAFLAIGILMRTEKLFAGFITTCGVPLPFQEVKLPNSNNRAVFFLGEKDKKFDFNECKDTF